MTSPYRIPVPDENGRFKDKHLPERLAESTLNATYVRTAAARSKLPIAVFGTSLTDGKNGLNAGEEWAALLATRLGVTVQNNGISGSKVTEILAAQEAANVFDQIQIIEMGANDIPLIENGETSVQAITAGYGTAVSRLTPVRPRFLVWGPLDRGAGEGASTPRGKWIREIEARLAQSFGPAFVNVRKYISENGLSDAGIAPTTQDTADMAAGAIPQSLRFPDSIHMNAAGHAVQARLFERVLRDLAWETYAPMKVPDPMVTNGSLMLIDPTNPQESWPGGVPANNDYLPNLAAAKAGAIVSGEVRPQWKVGALQSPTNSIFERSAKGGLHGIVSQALTASTDGQGAAIELPESIVSYIAANPTNDYYVSFWSRTTRISGATANWPFVAGIAAATAADTDYVQYWRTGIARPSAVPSMINRREPATPDQVGPSLRNVATNQVTNPNSATVQINKAVAAQWGTTGIDTYGGADHTKMPSFVFYRFYLEDLTVSGRTYSSVDALDKRLYDAQVAGSGGRYNGDTTPTAPSALP